MARSTEAEVARRVAEIFPLVCDCMSLREVRAWVARRTDWGAHISDAQLKRYLAVARRQLAEAACYDRDQELGAARRRLERIIARASDSSSPSLGSSNTNTGRRAKSARATPSRRRSPPLKPVTAPPSCVSSPNGNVRSSGSNPAA